MNEAAERLARIYSEVYGVPYGKALEIAGAPTGEEAVEVDELARLYSARGYLRAALLLLSLADAYAPGTGIGRLVGEAEEELAELEKRIARLLACRRRGKTG